MLFQGYPTGWFGVAFSSELAVGAVKPLSYFGRQLVLYRGEDGKPVILDAFCPHLGAHLGFGGTVEGNSIRCPFHAWRFCGDGSCAEVPYAKKIPLKAVIGTWPVQDRNGVILIYHDPSGKPPSYEMPLITEYGTAEWLPWSTNIFPMKTQPREIVENIADRAHFEYVHHTKMDEFTFETEGHIARQSTKGRAIFGDKFENISTVATYYGPGILVTQMEGMLKNFLLVLTTPVDQNHTDVRFAVTLKRVGTDEKTLKYMGLYMENLRTGFIQDQRIWENKVFRERPALCDGDGPIGKLRVWYRQFYPDVEAAPA